MRKIDGLKFLQKNFPDLTVDCLFVDKVENLDESQLEKSKLWRVRGGRTIGSELNLPQGTFSDKKELKKFMKEQKQKDRNMEFVIHRVSPEYFSAPFVGTLAVYNKGDRPGIKIELQEVTRELVNSIDTGKRPRDWEASPNLNMDFLKYPIVVIHEIGEQIFGLYENSNKEAETYTRFNIYDLGQVLLDDHRSKESFMEKYKFVPEPVNMNNYNKKSREDKEVEL